MNRLKISNKMARHLWLSSNLLSNAPTGKLNLMGVIRGLGFVQLDTIRVIERAHHHILWTRNQNYRAEMFDPLLAKDRAVFEHFTHDASIIPMETLPYWRRQFNRKRAQIDKGNWFNGKLDKKGRDRIKARIKKEGALSTHAFEGKAKASKEVWSRPPHKQALDYMWYVGELATCYREKFTKYYNLPERVFPDDLTSANVPDSQQVDHLCKEAINRLGFGTAKEIAHFWDAVSIAESREWIEASQLVPVSIEGADKIWRDAYAVRDIEARICKAETPTSRLRIINPFDPTIRDRDRLKRLFGMDYKIEIFVPKAKRKYGYYVYPLLEGARFVGRLEVDVNRKNATIRQLGLWPEKGVKWTDARQGKLESELTRIASFIGCKVLL